LDSNDSKKDNPTQTPKMILNAINRLAGGEESQEDLKKIPEYSDSSMLNFHRLSKKLDIENGLKVYVQQVPKKDNSKKKHESCDKIYVIFVN